MLVLFQSGFIQGMMHVFFLSMSAHLTEQLGMAPGGEFRRAFREVSVLNLLYPYVFNSKIIIKCNSK